MTLIAKSNTTFASLPVAIHNLIASHFDEEMLKNFSEASDNSVEEVTLLKAAVLRVQNKIYNIEVLTAAKSIFDECVKWQVTSWQACKSPRAILATQTKVREETPDGVVFCVVTIDDADNIPRRTFEILKQTLGIKDPMGKEDEIRSGSFTFSMGTNSTVIITPSSWITPSHKHLYSKASAQIQQRIITLSGSEKSLPIDKADRKES
jgi:hypothetical protein